MITTTNRQVPMAENIAFSFPATVCCNCGASENLSIIEQDTRLTRYFFGGGSEYTFRFRLPFCKLCAHSAKRRPAGLFRQFLMFGLAYVVSLLLITIIAIGTDIQILLEKGFIFAAIPAALFVGIMVAIARPRGNQSSYYQPVRILKLKQEFLSGKVLGIKLGFTNDRYEREFSGANNQAILQKVVESVKI